MKFKVAAILNLAMRPLTSGHDKICIVWRKNSGKTWTFGQPVGTRGVEP